MPRRGDGDGDRPRKSWSEIDKARGKSRHTSSDRTDRQQERLEKSQAYRQYKSNLDKFFEGGATAAPDGLKALLDPSGEKSARAKAIEAIQKASAEDRKKWSELVKAFVEEHELPPDPYLLTEFLGHPKERVAEKAMGKLEAMHEAGELKKVPPSLDQQLRSLELTADDDDLRERAKAFRERLRG
ncbi:hypothetical protein [Vulgatibacter sp.]|uniref:hypothetical protein n=1 Tax=Vulgatibacter sp. TaxID=1971226 RepID=UPI0035614CD3